MQLRTSARKLSPLVIILVIAIIFRLPDIGNTFTGDEIDIVGPARHFLIDGDFRQYNTCDGTPYYNFSHPPLRQFLYTAWAMLFGVNVAIRLLPIIFGLASIVVIYKLGKEMYSEKVGLIAALLAAVSRYHVYASDIVATDSGHFIFLTSAALLFFVMYAKKGKNLYMALFLIAMTLSLFSKLSAIVLFLPIIVTAYLYGRTRRTVLLLAAAVFFTVLIMSFSAQIIGHDAAFTSPFKNIVRVASVNPTLYEQMTDKLFKISTITWQMTPFLAVLLCISIYHSKKNKNTYILISWLLAAVLLFVLPYGSDAQRYFTVALPAVFLIIAKYTENFKPRKEMIITFFIFLLMAVFVSDILGYYNPFYIGAFYAISVVALASKKSTGILITGFLALSLVFAFTNSSVIKIGSGAVDDIVEKINTSGYDYREVWSSKDVLFKITPENETLRACELESLTSAYIKDNKIKYVAFYSTVPRQDEIDTLEKFCDGTEVFYRGYRIGIVCEVNQSKL